MSGAEEGVPIRHVKAERHNQPFTESFRVYLSGLLSAREMALQQFGGSSKASHVEGTTEFEILKASHQCVSQRLIHFIEPNSTLQVPPGR